MEYVLCTRTSEHIRCLGCMGVYKTDRTRCPVCDRYFMVDPFTDLRELGFVELGDPIIPVTRRIK